MEQKEKHLKEHQVIAKQRYMERKTQIPLANMSFKDTIPFISIVGPANTGKLKLFHSLISRLTKKELKPDNMITIATSKNKITLYKASSSLESYIDCSKVSDLVILTINGDSFEIDTFEIIGLMKSHGMSKVLVSITNSNKKTFKEIKKRIWSEIADGIKIYDMDINSNIDKMARHIKDMKYRPLTWKCNNSFVIADRIISQNIDDKFRYSLYGYIRGCPFKENVIHIPGKGTYNVLNKEVIEDPCFVSTGKILDKEKKIFYAPKFFDTELIKDDEIIEIEDENEEKFILFNMKEGKVAEEIQQPCDDVDIKLEKKEEIDNETDCDIETESEDLETLLNFIKPRFKKKAETGEELIEKFNDEFKDKDEVATDRENRLLQEAKNLLNNRKNIPGQYIKIEIETDKSLEFDFLTILGSVKITNQVTIQGRVKKTNHFPYILKSNQKYIISIGWKREIMDVVFSYKDPTRNRFLKYLLANSHCNANFHSQIVPPGTPFCIIQTKKYVKCVNTEDDKVSYKETEKFYRLAAMGTILDISGITGLVKKLKLIGHPKRILEHTVFVKDMFTSDKEVAKFEGALLKTVGGLRGSIKRSVGFDGTFRATFEGRILMSDIIFLRCYVPYEVNENELVSHKIESKKPGEINNQIENQVNITEIVESKKKRKTEKNIKQLKSQLTFDKQVILDENKTFTLPVSPLDEEFNNLKHKVEQKRSLKLYNAKKMAIEREIKQKKEQKILDSEKKERLRKNILESKFEKKLQKKKHKPKRR